MALKFPIFMDHDSTTPMEPEVLEAMLPYFREKFGHAASRSHSFGWEAEEAVEKARAQIAGVLGCKSAELVFTSGATESCNLAMKGVAWAYREKGNHIVTSKIEHTAVLDTCKRLEKEGFEATFLPVDRYGLVDPDDVKKAITERTILISIMVANHEIGTIEPIAEIGRIAKEKGVLFHTDAADAFGKIPCKVDGLNVDLMSISGHKIYGPKGIGALYIRMGRPRVKLIPLIDGGGHEKGRRSGTLNVPAIVGFGKAAEIAERVMEEDAERLSALRERLKQRLFENLDYVHLNGHPERRLPGNLNISFEFVEGESILMSVNRYVALSSGSACTTATLEPSSVMMAHGVGEELAHTSIRFSLGRYNTEEEVDFVAEKFIETIKKLRQMSPLYEMVLQGIDLKAIQWSAGVMK